MLGQFVKHWPLGVKAEMVERKRNEKPSEFENALMRWVERKKT